MTEISRSGIRLRNQAEHFATARGSSMRCDGGSRANVRGRCAGNEARRSFPVERTGRSGADLLRRRKYSQARGARAGVRNLPGASALRPGAGWQDIQAEIRASRVESSGQKPADQSGGDYGAESRVLRGSGFAAFERSGNNAPELERPHEGRYAAQELAALQRAVPSGGLAGPARLALSVHRVYGFDEGVCRAGKFAALGGKPRAEQHRKGAGQDKRGMPKRKDLKKILIIGSGPIIIGQACEFDYSGAQACKALRAEGYEVILVNSNPATIMTDPELAQRPYVEPLTKKYIEAILRRERQDALRLCYQLGFPLVIRPSFTLGGTGGSIAYNKEEFGEAIAHALDMSPVHEAPVEESVLGWKEFELEVMRDFRDNFVVICAIENFDPMGVHTGDSITVAPAQTLTDKEYQRMRDAAAAIIREVGVETGGSNVQFAVNPENGRMVVIEMNPRVSRSSALASKATGFPIAKIAARLAVGMSLDEIANDITKKTPACFEPTIDYVVTKIPKWQFEKFPGADSTLGTQMKSVGEVMAIGRTFKESLQKGIRSLEPSSPWRAPADAPDSLLREKLATPRPDRIHWILTAVERGLPAQEICELTKIDPWFIHQIEELTAMNRRAAGVTVETASKDLLREVKRHGTSDEQLAQIWKTTPAAVRLQRAR